MLFCCHSSLLKGLVKFCQDKYVIWHTCLAEDLEKKTSKDPCGGTERLPFTAGGADYQILHS